MTDITLHPKFGVNPSVTVCYLCGESIGLALYGNKARRVFGREEAPHEVIDTSGPCAECLKYMEAGYIIIIGMTNEAYERIPDLQRQHDEHCRQIANPDNRPPFLPTAGRTGHYVVVKKRWAERMQREAPEQDERDYWGRVMELGWTILPVSALQSMGVIDEYGNSVNIDNREQSGSEVERAD